MVEQLSGQLSIWDILTEDQLPAAAEEPAPRLIAPEDFHVGVKGWMIHTVVFEQGRFAGMMIVYTDRWVSTKEPKLKDSGWSTAGELVRRKGDSYSCWYGGFRTLYWQTPTFDERIQAAHRSKEYRPGMRIIDADIPVALEGEPLNDEEKDVLRRWHK